MRNMLALCDLFATEYDVVFNARKRKCLYVNSCVNRSRTASAMSQFSIGGGNSIEFVDEWPRHIITAVRDNKADIYCVDN